MTTPTPAQVRQIVRGVLAPPKPSAQTRGVNARQRAMKPHLHPRAR